MIHIIRPGETADDIAYIYNVSKDKILNCNPHFTEFENGAVWVDTEGIVLFNEITKERALTPYYEYDGLKYAIIHSPDSLEESFVPIDNWARNAENVFVDGYRTDDVTWQLNLPYDYPSINACLINNIVPGFVLRETEKYLNENILNMLLTDLSFKEYQNVLLIAKNYGEYKAAFKLKKIFSEDGFGVSLACSSHILKNADDFSGYECVYYMTERNIIDFESFVNNVLCLLDKVQSDRAGVLYKPGYVDMNKSLSEIEYISPEKVRDILRNADIKKINYDEESKLSWARFEDNNGYSRSILFEDFRTFYAKAAFLKEKQIKNICFDGCDCYAYILSKIFGIVK